MIIYKITNTENDKCYIGQTIQNFCNRKGVHIHNLKNNKHDNPYLQNSWNKYGEDCFEFEVLEKCESLEELNKREKELIDKLNTLDKERGYNLRSGGKNDKLCEEHKRKIGEANKISQKGLHEGKKNYFYGKSFCGEDHPFYGKKHTKESKKKMGARAVIQYDLEDNYINEYYGVNEASRQTDIPHSLISRVCSGKRKTTGGFKFKYKNK